MNGTLTSQTTKDTTIRCGNWTFPLSNVWLVIIFACTLATGFLPETLLSLVMLGSSALLVGSRKIHLVYPVMLFYYSVFGLLAGMSIYRWFTFIFLFVALLEQRTLKLFQVRQILPFFLFVAYCVVIIMPDSLQRTVFAVMDMACILVLINHYLQTLESVKGFFTGYVIAALMAYVTGLQGDVMEQVTMMNGEIVTLERNCATFEDPNYMGFFYTVAVFAMVALKLFNPKIRVALVVVLYAMLFSSLSLTAIIVNTALWLVYLMITKKINFKSLAVIVAVIAALVGLYQYGLKHPDTAVIGDLSVRIEEKLDESESGDYDFLTSGRTSLVKRHWEYYTKQPLLKQIFGMNAASALKTELGSLRVAAHNDYIDLLLNVGLVGTFIMLGFFFLNLRAAFQTYRQEGDTRAMCIVMCKLVWMAYAFTLTMYGDWRFWLCFFM